MAAYAMKRVAAGALLPGFLRLRYAQTIEPTTAWNLAYVSRITIVIAVLRDDDHAHFVVFARTTAVENDENDHEHDHGATDTAGDGTSRRAIA